MYWRAILIAFSIASAPPSVKKTLSRSPGRSAGQLLAEARSNLGDERGLDELQPGGLLDDGVDDPPVAVTDVHRHQLTVEVEDAPLPSGVNSQTPSA